MGISKYENAAAVDEALDKGVEAFNKTQGGFAAENVSYDNSKSEIEAENVQDAIDSMKDEFHEEITHVNTSIASKISIPEMDEEQIATIGQVLAVKAVGEDGNPTEWKVVDQSGGVQPPDEFALIGDQLYVAEIDDDGNPIKWSYHCNKKDVSELTYKEIASIVRSGRAEEVFKIGDQIITTYTDANGTQYEMPWDVVSFREAELEDGSIVPGMIIQSHYATVEKMEYDSIEPSSPNTQVKTGGWNSWKYSNIRQWLNSTKEKGQWWTKAHTYDAAPGNLNSVNGFIKGLSTEFVNMLKPTKHETSLNYVYPSGNQNTYVYDTTYDIFFLPSGTEENFARSATDFDNTNKEGSAWEYWIQRKGTTPQSGTNYNASRISLTDQKSAANVSLRTIRRNESYSYWYVDSNYGQLGAMSCSGTMSCAPAAIIC